MSAQPVLSIVIVTYNSAGVLPGLLDTLPDALLGVPAYRIVVADNASGDNSVKLARAHASAPMLVETGYNGGFAAAINTAVARIGNDGPLLVLNPDIRLQPHSIARMLARLADTTVGAVAPRLLTHEGELSPSVRREPSLLSAWSEAVLGGTLAGRLGWGEVVRHRAIYRQGGSIAWATGAALLISQAARVAVGEWDERYFLYSEEVDYLRRVRMAGFDVVYAPEAQGTHFGGESNVNPQLYALLTANRIRYYQRYHGAMASSLFRWGVGLGEAGRMARGATHRAALRAVFQPGRTLAGQRRHQRQTGEP